MNNLKVNFKTITAGKTGKEGKMKTKIEKIREVIGNVKNYPVSIRKTRHVGQPMRRKIKEELQSLSNEEISIAYYLGLIGNNGHEGKIIKNAKEQPPATARR